MDSTDLGLNEKGSIMVFKVDDIRRPSGIKKKGKRKGRGVGSGRGKTSGRGHKGAKSRSGGGKYTPGFEGGQMPLVRRLPKRGFTNKFKKEWSVVNLIALEESDKISDGAIVDKQLLLETGMIKKRSLPVKLLGKGQLKKKLTVKVDAYSASAREAVESAGGKAELTEK